MKLKRKNNTELVLGAQAFRTSTRSDKYGWEWNFNILPHLHLSSRADRLTGARVIRLGIGWLLWGAEVYAYTTKKVEVPETPKK